MASKSLRGQTRLEAAGPAPTEVTTATPMPTPPSVPVAALTPSLQAAIVKDLQEALQALSKDMVENLRKVLREELKKEMEDFFERKIQEVVDFFQTKNEELREDIRGALEGLNSHVNRIDECLEEMNRNNKKTENKVFEVEENMERIDSEVVMNQYRSMEFALRIRGMKEDPKEDLYEKIAQDLAPILDWQPHEIIREMDQVFRVNSWIARQRKLPRDVVVYFTKRSTRNTIIKVFFDKRFQIAGQDITILKEIPPKMFKKRKDFTFLTDELKKRQINFRWEIPEGLVVNYSGAKHRLNTVLKAKDFYYYVLKAGSPPSPPRNRREKDQTKNQEQMALTECLEGEKSSSIGDTRSITQEIGEGMKEQRMTRAAYRRQEKEGMRMKTYAERAMEKAATTITSATSTVPATTTTTATKATTSGAMGEARSNMQQDLQASPSKLHATKDGSKVLDMEC